MIPIVLDFDNLDIDTEDAREKLLELQDIGLSDPSGKLVEYKDRLQAIVDEADEEEFAEEDFEDEDDEDFDDLELDEDDDEDFEDGLDDDEDDEDEDEEEETGDFKPASLTTPELVDRLRDDG